jgi:hypothetical protein
MFGMTERPWQIVLHKARTEVASGDVFSVVYDAGIHSADLPYVADHAELVHDELERLLGRSVKRVRYLQATEPPLEELWRVAL